MVQIPKRDAVKRKYKKPTRLTPSQVADLQHKYANADPRLTAKQVCNMLCEEFKISTGTFHKKIQPVKKRMMKTLMSTDVEKNANEHNVNLNVNASASTLPTHTNDTVGTITLSELSERSRAYIGGMSVIFSKATEEVIDDLVELSLGFQAVEEIHGKKPEES